jgi:hypothetical protein
MKWRTQFLDRNGNITEAPTANDRVLTGKSMYPKLTGDSVSI